MKRILFSDLEMLIAYIGLSSAKTPANCGLLFVTLREHRNSLSLSSQVRISLFDALGKEVRVLGEGFYPAGQNSVSFGTDDLPSGMYFVRCNIGGQVVVRRLAVAR
jgi:hypothetical protein